MRVLIECGCQGRAFAVSRIGREVSLAAFLLAVQVVLHPLAALENARQAPPFGARLPVQKRLPEASPFRLEIQRSEYRIVSGASSPKVKSGAAEGLSPMIERHAAARGLDPALVHAVIKTESAYRPEAVSPKGAVGLMQVMPATGRRFGVSDLDRPESNLKAGTTYLRHLLDRFDNVSLALAAYNAGEGAVRRFGNAIPPYPETRGYVQEVLRSYGKVVQENPVPRVYVEGVRLIDGDLASYRLIDTARH